MKNGAIVLERLFELATDAIFADPVQLVLPPHMIVAVDANFESAIFQIADDRGASQCDRPRRQEGPGQHGPHPVHADRFGAKHLADKAAVPDRASYRLARVIGPHRDEEARRDALAREHPRESRHAELEPLMSIDVNLQRNPHGNQYRLKKPAPCETTR